jgi:class 3 adenylate cyclase
MEPLAAYLPVDRRHALAHGRDLPDRTQGTALFADISGFTPLTESLLNALGPQRGAEELSRHLNTVFDAIIAEVDRYGGSVLGFSGDAITCWFDGDPGRRAATCGLAMQAAMRSFAALTLSTGEQVALAMKVALATGPGRQTSNEGGGLDSGSDQPRRQPHRMGPAARKRIAANVIMVEIISPR